MTTVYQTSRTDRETDGRLTVAIPVHCAVKMKCIIYESYYVVIFLQLTVSVFGLGLNLGLSRIAWSWYIGFILRLSSRSHHWAPGRLWLDPGGSQM